MGIFSKNPRISFPVNMSPKVHLDTISIAEHYRGDLGHMGYFALNLNNLLDNNSISHFLALKGHLAFLLHH